MSVRVYLAAGAGGVRSLRDAGTVRAPGYAVTPAMRAADPRADEEDLEYEAALLAEGDLRSRDGAVVVVAADVSRLPAEHEPGAELEVPASSVVALHVAEHGASEDEELLWYDATELDDVAAYLGI
ncbi:DUF6912 family protein [Mobilicoccus massiliensis]|uniref:DUF6912 family protein n=1 Tax=Mobilicoccus massiliensis TaxID=1522310 RepID=UPI0006949400|nr:hypothetical protein [Mobilicoccus massiliensis]